MIPSQVQENKEKEERQQRDETLKQQRQLVEYLGEKLEKLSMRIEEKEKEKSANGAQLPAADATSPTPVFVVPCPLCGHVGVHQHGGRFFNGYNLITLPEKNVGNTTSRLGNTTGTQRVGNDDILMMQG